MIKKLTAFLMVFSISYFWPVNLNATPKNCLVKVSYGFKTGAQGTKKYRLSAKSRLDCERKSKLYQINSSPTKLNSKKVTAHWMGL